jgi:hypothetical protein
VFDGGFHAFDLMGAKTSIGCEATAFITEVFKYASEYYFCEQAQTSGEKSE